MTARIKIVLGVVGVIVLFGVITVTLIMVNRPRGAGRPPIGDSTGARPTETGPTPEQAQVTAIADAVLLGGDPSLCAGAGDAALADHCFALVAYGRGESSLCENIQAEIKKQECRGALIADRAESEQNPELCLSIGEREMRTSCFVRATIERGNTEEFCGRLEEPDRTDCIAVITPSNAEGETPSPEDADSDGLYDSDEARRGTDPADPDSDGDTLNDGAEAYQYHTNPLAADSDSDGLTDADEVGRGTNPNAADTDGDGLDDRDELARTTDPKLADSDSDGLTDGEEVSRYLTNPKNLDTDGDGFSDGTEVQNGFNPRGPGRL